MAWDTTSVLKTASFWHGTKVCSNTLFICVICRRTSFRAAFQWASQPPMGISASMFCRILCCMSWAQQEQRFVRRCASCVLLCVSYWGHSRETKWQPGITPRTQEPLRGTCWVHEQDKLMIAGQALFMHHMPHIKEVVVMEIWKVGSGVEEVVIRICRPMPSETRHHHASIYYACRHSSCSALAMVLLAARQP